MKFEPDEVFTMTGDDFKYDRDRSPAVRLFVLFQLT